MTEALSTKRTLIGLLATGLVAFAALPATAGAMQQSATKPGAQTITQLVVNNPNFDVLEAAVIEANLAGALDGTTQLTVFAPTDRGFMKTLGVTTEDDAIAAVKALPDETLKDILLYHVTEGRRSSISVLLNRSYPMLNGDTLTRFEVLKSGLVATDIKAKNGVVHVISSVLMPR